MPRGARQQARKQKKSEAKFEPTAPEEKAEHDDLENARKLAGHTSVDTTARYDRRGDERLRVATDNLERGMLG